MLQLFDWMHDQTLWSWAVISLIGNTAVMALSIAACWLVMRHLWRGRKIFESFRPVTANDVLLVSLTAVLNSVVGVIGWILWQHGWIRITHPGPLRIILDTVLFLMLMDLAMYVFHRAAHIPFIFNWVHKTHHAHVATNALSLYVLSPIEVFGFGAMEIGILMLIPLSGLSIFLFLALNQIFGTMGHFGVEPLPPRWMRFLCLRQIGTCTFHCQHHTCRDHNFGFYTVIWDRIFGTLHPEYDRRITGH